jgi:hypothetical protein
MMVGGAWYSFQGPDLTAAGQAFLTAMQTYFGPGKVSTGGLLSSLEPAIGSFQQATMDLDKSFRAVIDKAREIGNFNPLSVQANSVFSAEAQQLPKGVEVNKDFLAKLFAVSDFCWGIVDTVTAGLTAKIRDLFELGNWGPGPGSLRMLLNHRCEDGEAVDAYPP